MQSSSPSETRLPVYQGLSGCHATKCTTDTGTGEGGAKRRRCVSRDYNVHLPHYEAPPRCEIFLPLSPHVRIILMKTRIKLIAFLPPARSVSFTPIPSMGNADCVITDASSSLPLTPVAERVNYVGFILRIARANAYIPLISPRVNRSYSSRDNYIPLARDKTTGPSVHVTRSPV